MISNFRWKADHRRAVANIIKMKQAFLIGSELESTSRNLLNQIKQIVVVNLQDDSFSRRNPQATKRETFTQYTKKIAAAVNVVILRDKLSLMGGIGEITRLDEADPLLSLSNPPRVLTPEVRLWRILEYGTVKKDYPIKAKNVTERPSSKAPTRATSKLPFSGFKEGKGSRGPVSGKQIPQLRFFWRKANVSFRGPMVIHPGQEGRGVWAAVLASEVRMIYGRGMQAKMKQIVKQYSGR